MTVKSAEAGVVSHEAPETNEKKSAREPVPEKRGKKRKKQETGLGDSFRHVRIGVFEKKKRETH